MKYISLLFLCFFSFCSPAISQNRPKVSYQTDTNQIMTLVRACNDYRVNNPDTSILLGEKALELAQKIRFTEGEAWALLRLSAAYRQHKDFKKSLQNGEQSLAIFQEIKNKKGEGIAFNNIGIHYYKLRKYNEAITYYAKALTVHESIASSENIAMNLSNIGNVYNDEGKYELALSYYFKSLNIKEKLNNPKSLASTLNNIGLAYTYQDDLTNALVYYNKALKANEIAKNASGVIDNLNNIGNIYENTGKYDKALEAYTQLLVINETTKNIANVAHTLDHIGKIHKNLSDLPLALEYYQKALKINEEIKDDETIPINLLNIGDIYRQQKKFDQSLTYYNKALGYYEKLNFKKEIADTYNKIGKLYQESNNNDDALNYHQRALKISEATNDKGRTLQSVKGIGKVYQSKQEYAKSIDYFQKALAIAQQIGITAEIQDLCFLLYKSNKANNNYTQALFYYELSKNIKDSLFSIEKIQKIATLESKLALGRKEQELVLLKKDGELQRLETARQKNARLATEKQAEAQRYFSLAREEKSKRKADSLYALAQKAQLETNILKAQDAQVKAENNANILEKKAAISENKRQKIISYTAIISLFLALFAVFFIYISWRNQKNAKEEIAEQKEEIEAQAEQLEVSNQTKDRIFAIIAHDLRNPIMSFQGVAKQIQFFLKKDKPERVIELTETIDLYSNSLNNLLDNLLNWALVQRKDMQIQAQRLQLKEEIDTCLQGFHALAKASNVSLRNNISPEITVIIDKNILHTIVRNLVSNAIKFTPENGVISIDSITENKQTKLIITDTGIGISDEKIAILFQLTKNKNTEGIRGEKGIGIGINLCYELAKISNAKLEVTSELNKGTTFYLTI